MFYAHSRPGEPKEKWDPLEAHLERTASRALGFLPQAPELAYLAGLWHDAGKYQAAFQRYLVESNEASNEERPAKGKVKHSIVGAALAHRVLQDASLQAALAWAIAAHHGSLSDKPTLIGKIKNPGIPLLDSCVANISRRLFDPPQPPAIPLSASGPGALWIRMLLSALTDADMLDTESWDQGCERDGGYATVCTLHDRLEEALRRKAEELVREGLQDRPLNAMRDRVLRECLRASKLPPGQFTLTVPTGGGKTLSSLAFALHHACAYGLQRVIVVIPYTTIIEQTADVIRAVLGAENVVEHHSSVDLEKDTLANQRACENWDAPVIVTTSVQFFESLYAARKTRCRKLHNIGKSVVVLDEVQTFPVDLLAPIRRVLGLLSQHFGTTIVHCTATQPTPEPGSMIGPRMDPAPRPIIAHPEPDFEVVRNRFRIVLEKNLEEPMSLEELAGELDRYACVMAIVHRRREAEELAGLVEGCWHLSARMCAAHRKAALDTIRESLKAGRPCRLVATQLVEAGVDISFPVVFRALAGLETLAQAAGRCNRELDGERPGEFHIYQATSEPPSNSLRRELAVAIAFLKRPGFTLDLNDPALFSEYFRAVLDEHVVNTDAPGVAVAEREMNFPEVERRFRMIEENGQSVLAPYGDAKRLLASLRVVGPTRQNLRGMQRLFVSLYDREIEELLRLGVIEPLYRGCERAWAVRDGSEYIYSERFGFGWKGIRNPEPEQLIA
jgi:CRISPR-associated endonuclease/helicase Cas3